MIEEIKMEDEPQRDEDKNEKAVQNVKNILEKYRKRRKEEKKKEEEQQEHKD